SYTKKSDIVNCINLGFDHVKLQLTPEWMINERGDLITENMAYVASLIEMVIELNYRVILCISPSAAGIDYDFKARYLGDLENFEKLVRWYEQVGEFIKNQHWSADYLAVQL